MPTSPSERAMKKKMSETFFLLITHWTTFDISDAPNMHIEESRKTIVYKFPNENTDFQRNFNLPKRPPPTILSLPRSRLSCFVLGNQLISVVSFFFFF